MKAREWLQTNFPWDGIKPTGISVDEIVEMLEAYAATLQEGGECYVEGDWAAYNWLDDEGNDDWKMGRIVKVRNSLIYFNDDGTERCGYMPISEGVVPLKKKLLPQISEVEIDRLWDKYCDTAHEAPEWMFKEHFKEAITQLMKGGEG